MLGRLLGYLILGSMWLFAVVHLWLAATQGMVPALRRFSYSLTSFEDAGLAGVISLLILLVITLVFPIVIWSIWHSDRHMRTYLQRRELPIDTAIRKQLDDI